MALKKLAVSSAGSDTHFLVQTMGCDCIGSYVREACSLAAGGGTMNSTVSLVGSNRFPHILARACYC